MNIRTWFTWTLSGPPTILCCSATGLDDSIVQFHWKFCKDTHNTASQYGLASLFTSWNFEIKISTAHLWTFLSWYDSLFTFHRRFILCIIRKTPTKILSIRWHYYYTNISEIKVAIFSSIFKLQSATHGQKINPTNGVVLQQTDQSVCGKIVRIRWKHGHTWSNCFRFHWMR